jgi:thiamine-phosphate pyrophosphorylase
MIMAMPLFCSRCGHPLISKELDGRVRDYCISCEAAQYRNPIPATAAIVRNPEGAILLVKRGMPPQAGEWCLPGGYIELDEEADESCLRELWEETGLDGRAPVLVGIYHSESPFYHSVLVSAYVATVRDFSTLQAGDDSVDCRFFQPQEMPKLAFCSHQRALDTFLKREPPILRKTGAPWGAYLITADDPLARVEAAIQGGVRIVQYRDKTADKATLYRTALALRNLTREAGVLLIINDHADLAMAVDADGVHIGQEDMPIEALRAILPPQMLIGLSTHSREQALDAVKRGADYIGCGPLFATPTKAHYQAVGLDLLAWVLNHVDIPVVAIGGIDMTNLSEVAAPGARNVAMVRAFAEDTENRIKRINRRLLSDLSDKSD